MNENFDMMIAGDQIEEEADELEAPLNSSKKSRRNKSDYNAMLKEFEKTVDWMRY